MSELKKALGGAYFTLRDYSGQRSAAFQAPDGAENPESQAALRQMSVERLMGYGVHHPDALELRARVWSGASWQSTATELAEECLRPPEKGVATESLQTRANRLFRASALLRMSQMMMVEDNPDRAAIVAWAAALFDEAANITGAVQRRLFETPNGKLVGWLYPARSAPAVGRVVVIGGIEGWAMDFAEMGSALAARNIDALLLDGPGQGESRISQGHFLAKGWEASYGAVFGQLLAEAPDLLLGFIGNSMGGSVALHLARHDDRISAVCDNGGGAVPGRKRENRVTFERKMASHVGAVSVEGSRKIWATVDPIDRQRPLKCPLLVVHGGLDPLVSSEDARLIFETAETENKQMVVFSDGDHCVYNHSDDKHDLIADWMASRLGAQRPSSRALHA